VALEITHSIQMEFNQINVEREKERKRERERKGRVRARVHKWFGLNRENGFIIIYQSNQATGENWDKTSIQR